jgi:hypothetical protein
LEYTDYLREQLSRINNLEMLPRELLKEKELETRLELVERLKANICLSKRSK